VSALYPAPSPAATAWLSTLRAALAGLAGQVRLGPPIDVDSVAAHLESESPEAAELGAALTATLDEFKATISGLTAAFGLFPSTLLIALGRGEEVGELDPVVASALGEVAEIKALTSSGTVTIEKDGRSTTLVAATTVAAPAGPIRVAWPDRDDVWLCAVRAAPTPVLTARAALERILPHAGVQRARLGITATEPHAALHAALVTIDPTADPDLVMARLEGWRAALEQLHRGAVTIHWEQA
jgi:hypothetical protein